MCVLGGSVVHGPCVVAWCTWVPKGVPFLEVLFGCEKPTIAFSCLRCGFRPQVHSAGKGAAVGVADQSQFHYGKSKTVLGDYLF